MKVIEDNAQCFLGLDTFQKLLFQVGHRGRQFAQLNPSSVLEMALHLGLHELQLMKQQSSMTRPGRFRT